MKIDKICATCGRKFAKSEDFYAMTNRWRICENKHLWFNCACGSTNIIRNGRYPWYDQTHNLSSAAKSLFNHIPKLDELPRIPTRIMELERILGDEKVDSSKLAEVSREDPVLCAMILQVANSRASNRSKLTSLVHAITFIGLSQMRDIVTLASLSQMAIPSRVFSKDEFWHEAMLVGHIAENLADRMKLSVDADMTFIAGCLCNIGKVVTALCYPEIADRIAMEMNDSRHPCAWIEIEERHGGYQHAVMGEIGAMFWGLPDEVSDVIAYHHILEPNKHNDRQTLIDVVSLANQFSHWSTNHIHRMNMDLFEGLLKKFKIENQQAEYWCEDFAKKK